jgi:hypothetical protein
MAMQALSPSEARVIPTPAHEYGTVETTENGVLPYKFSVDLFPTAWVPPNCILKVQ